ncbi:hypothetical protein [Candidatus Venteria ishoeyi]|uniref:DUF4276 domain-containing protein n=1 Tax=Candidatus Venteria ishoeyi TaxID=1899563 RepID=A0A1H6FGY6_9GAMM|nr:hypothetical protein [Candidatus Venteria ishoeyi]MDM8546887.1 hypothetical protein [Candidatus Venteria ishoeyi]SEH08701.1 Uncharacterised protein [Candidatus Venteria ishoeyi]
MNIYFLVEGKTERKVYPKWLSHLAPTLKRVSSPSDAVNNNYYLISGGGFPSILDNHLVDSVSDIQESGKYNYFVIIIDTDDHHAEKKIEEVNQFVENNNLTFKDCKFIVIPQVVCMETWFLGNRRIYTRNPESSENARIFTKYYNISQSDPEKMSKPSEYNGSIADYHYQYLKTMLAEKNIRYSKSNPKEVTEIYYLNELKSRVLSEKNSLKSMGEFLSFLSMLKLSSETV